MPVASNDQAVIMVMQHINAGQIGQAEKLCGELLAKTPMSAPVLHAAGLVHYMKRDFQAAIEHIEKAVQIDDRNPQYYSNLGEAHRRAGTPEEALKAFERALVLKPEFLKAHLGAGNTLRDLKRFEEATAKFRLALAINPNFAEAYHYLGVAFIEQEQVGDALPLLRKAVALRPGYMDAHVTLANALEMSGLSEEALATYRQILERDPNNIGVHNNIGNILKNLGRIDEAVSHYNQALELDPDHAPAYYNLSRSQVGSKDEEVVRMESLLEDPRLGDERRVNLHFALGKIYDDMGLYEKAFHHFKNGNDLDTRGEEFHPDHHSMMVDRLLAVFNKDFLSNRKGLGSESELPVFIVGMPRSGTTLVEQILSSHPKVFGAGELDYIGRVIASLQKSLSGVAGYPELAFDLDAVSACKYGDEYVGMLQQMSGDALRVTDKMPGNFLHLGMISLLLPKARVIVLRREPLDTCLSCFFQHFTAIMPYTRELTGLGRYYRDFDRIVTHWKNVLPSNVMEVQYEEVIADHEGMSRKIVEFTGLEWDEACLEFYKTDRPVKTASSWQVRQPIYSSSVARWRNYEPFLGPLREGMGEELIKRLSGAGKEKPVKKPARKKAAAKKAPVRKPAAKKPAAKKAPARKPAAKKPVVKKAPARKTVARKKPVTKKPVPKKSAIKKPAIKKPAIKKPAAKKAAARKPVVQKTADRKKPVAKKPVAKKKPAVKKPTVRKAVAKKTAAGKGRKAK